MFETNLDDLPQETGEKMWLAGVKILGTDINDIASNSLSRVQRQREVLVNLIDAQLGSAVDCSFVDSVRLRQVDQHAETENNRRRLFLLYTKLL